MKGYLVFHQDTLKVPAPLNPSDKRGKTRGEDPSYLLPLSGELGGYGGLRDLGGFFGQKTEN